MRPVPGLADLPTDDLITLLGAVGERFPDTLDEKTIALVAANAGLSPPMTREVLAGMAASWTTDALGGLVRAEFPDPRVLDEFAEEDGREVRAAAPGVTLHLGAGSVPGVTITSMLRALLVRSPVLVKPGAGDAVLSTLFARELHRADPRLAAAVAVHYWPGGAPARASWERELLALADQVVVYGDDDTIKSVRTRAPASTRLVEHLHRLGVAIVDPNAAPRSGGRSGASGGHVRPAGLREHAPHPPLGRPHGRPEVVRPTRHPPRGDRGGTPPRAPLPRGDVCAPPDDGAACVAEKRYRRR